MKVVVIGAGIGGVALAKRLTRFSTDIQVTVIEPNVSHDFAPSFLWLLDGSRSAAQISRPTATIAEWGVELISERVTAVDTEARMVTTTGPTVGYDELVVAPGAEMTFETIPGLDSASSFYSKNAAAGLSEKLLGFEGGDVAIVVPSMPYKCPAAPYESAFLIDHFLRKRGVDARVRIHTIEPQPMPVAGPVVGGRVASMLKQRGIGFHPNQKLVEVDAAAGTLRFEGSDDRFDLLIAIPAHRPPAFVRDSSLAGPSGWIPVDSRSLRAADGVHAIGDVTAIQLANGKPLPKAGVFAHEQAHVVAGNLIATAKGAEPRARFAGHGSCFLETGSGKAGIAKGDFYAEPDPRVKMFPPSRLGHFGKVLFERRWLKQFG
ncbi:MAG: NAD(P)/FAD-dependent oxidoreductase [Actinobacteria bacterium]|nr:NAD(P)/FAD-dependent oxidoreductase [Actinomycetota bacterium]